MREILIDPGKTYSEGVKLEIKPGMAWALYADKGPTGLSGQDSVTNSPHAYLMTWPNQEAMMGDLSAIPRNNNHMLMHGVVDSHVCNGVFWIIKHEE